MPKPPHKYDDLGPAGRRLARIPRYGRLIARLPADRFEWLVSAAATFWEVYTRGRESVLASGLQAVLARNIGVPDGKQAPEDEDFWKFQIERACDVLGAIAFEMFASEGKPKFVESDTKKLKQDVVNRLFNAGAGKDFYGDPITKPDLFCDLKAVCAMDSHELKYLIFTEQEREMRWTDISTQAFFAAYWASRWPADVEKLRTWLPGPLTGSNSVYSEFWRMLAEMPDEAIHFERWQTLLSPLYDGSLRDNQGDVVRSTELIYLSWKRMKDTPAGRQFCGEFARRLETNDVARRLVCDSSDTSQFLSLCQGERGPGDTGTFMMGATDGENAWRGERSRHRVSLSRYLLHRYCVTNLQYELFEPRRRAVRAFADKGLNVDDHPVVNVSWYDAWCFATWLGELIINGTAYRVELPTEAQWEYACRCGRSTPFTWSDGRDGNKIESDYCNYDGNSPWQRAGTTAARAGRYRGRTVDVKEFVPNAWGLHQMHGNVGEWCHDWYGPDYYRVSTEQDPRGPAQAISRVVRGGSWINDGEFCRSAYRDWLTPGYRSGNYGFRLAAVPQGQASQE